MRIFVAGTGFTGERLLRRLTAAGHELSALNRRGALSGLPAVHWRQGDVLQPDSLVGLSTLPPQDLLITTLSGAGLRDPADYRALYVDGPRRLLDRLPWGGAPRVWMLGSTGVYGETDGGWVDEETPPSPRHAAGEVQLAAETALRAACAETVVLRLSGLYGPGRVRLIRQAMRRRPLWNPDLWSNQIHGEDVAEAVAFLLGVASPPELLLLSDDLPAPRGEILQWIREQAGSPEGFLEEDHPARAEQDRGNKRVSNRRLRALGFQFRYPDYRRGLAPLLPEVLRELKAEN